jgi:hypothetical protein
VRFAAPRDRLTRIVTLAVVAGAIAGVVAIARAAWRTEHGALLAVAAIASLALGAGIGLAWALAPSGFAIEGGAVRVLRPLRPVAIPLGAIRSVGLLPPRSLRGALRLGGSGGLFGYYGRFWTRALGSFRLHATRAEGLVRLDTDRERFVLSPDPPERFVEELRTLVPRTLEEGDLAPHPNPLARRIWIQLAVMLGGILFLVGSAAWAAWREAPRSARVERDAVIVVLGSGPVEIPLASIREAEILPPGALDGARRVHGLSMGELRSGRFRSQPLGSFQLYAWRRGPAVLLETAGGRIVLTPDEPEAFVEAVRARLRR